MANRGRPKQYDWQLSVHFDKVQRAEIEWWAEDMQVSYAEAVRQIFDRGILSTASARQVRA